MLTRVVVIEILKLACDGIMHINAEQALERFPELNDDQQVDLRLQTHRGWGELIIRVTNTGMAVHHTSTDGVDAYISDTEHIDFNQMSEEFIAQLRRVIKSLVMPE